MNEVLLSNLLTLGVPFMAFFLGIVIRQTCLPCANKRSLWKNLLIGMPLGCGVVSGYLSALSSAVATDQAVYLTTVGILIKEGMFLESQLNDLLNRRQAVED